MKIKISIFFIFLVSISCITNRDIPEFELIRKLISNVETKDSCIVLIIPFDGCSSCFEEAVAIIPEITDKGGVVIISERQVKRVKSFIERYEFNPQRIVVDSTQSVLINGIIETKPKIFKLDRKRIQKSFIVEYSQINEINEYIFN